LVQRAGCSFQDKQQALAQTLGRLVFKTVRYWVPSEATRSGLHNNLIPEYHCSASRVLYSIQCRGSTVQTSFRLDVSQRTTCVLTQTILPIEMNLVL